MKLTPDTPDRTGSRFVFTGYGSRYVSVNHVRHEVPVVVTPESVSPWPVRDAASLTAAQLAALLDLRPELVILGTGSALRFPVRGVTRPLLEARVGVEVMDTPAACRTYNILNAEGRRVVAAVIVE